MKNRLINYIKTDDIIDKFRSLTIGVVKKKTNNRGIVESVQKEHGFDIVKKLDDLNSVFRVNNRSAFFDFCSVLENKGIDMVRCKKDIRRKYFLLKDEFARKQLEVESKLLRMMQ